MNTRLVEIVDRLKSPRIFVLGDLILDRYVWGSVHRVSPKPRCRSSTCNGRTIDPGGPRTW